MEVNNMEADIKVLHNKLLEMLIDLNAFCKEHNIDYMLAYGSVLGAVRHQGFIPWDDDLDICMTVENYDKFIKLFKNTDKYFLQRDTIDYPLQFSKLRCNNTAFIEKIRYRKPYKTIHQGIYIDIFCLEKVSNNYFLRFFQVFFSNIILVQSLTLRGYQPQNYLKYVFMFFSILFLPFRSLMLCYMRKFKHIKKFDYYCCLCAEAKKIFLPRYICEAPFSIGKFENKYFPVPNDADVYLRKNYGNYMQLPPEAQRVAKMHATFFSVDHSYEMFLNL